MTLTPGTRLGPYEILASVGVGLGGMGEVWKAHDMRLNRLVAIKRLKPDSAARFQQEARAIAALGPPHLPDFRYRCGLPGARIRRGLAGPVPGPHERALEQIRRALEEDPLNIYSRVMFGAELFACGRFIEAEEAQLRALDLDPNYWLGYAWRSTQRAVQGRLEEACADAQRAYQAAPWNVIGIGVHAGLLALAGDQPAAENLIHTLGDSSSSGRHAVILRITHRASNWTMPRLGTKRPSNSGTHARPGSPPPCSETR